MRSIRRTQTGEIGLEVFFHERSIIIIIIRQIFTEDGLSHSRMLFMRVLYLTNYIDLLKHLKN